MGISFNMFLETSISFILQTLQGSLSIIHGFGAVLLLSVSICIVAHNTKEVAVCARALLHHLLAYYFPKDLSKLPYGRWAVITGATEGIGAAYARAFAKRGMNVFIIARTSAKLEKMAAELKASYQVDVEYCSIDFSGNVRDYIVQLRKSLHKAREGGAPPIADSIGILVNNVGMLPYAYDTLANDIMRRAEENPTQIYAEGMQAALNTNCASQMVMTAEIMNLIRNKPAPRGNDTGIKGVIISLSSYTAKRPMPFWVTYTACKAFNYYFSEALHREIGFTTNDLIVQTVQPMEVATSMAPKEKAGWRAPNADMFVEQCINLIGWSNKTSGWPVHDLRALFNDFFGAGSFGVYLVLFSRYKKITAGRIRKHHAKLRNLREKLEKRVSSGVNGVKRTLSRVSSGMQQVKRTVSRANSNVQTVQSANK